MSLFHTQRKQRCIYAIHWDEDGESCVHIWHTTSNNLRSVLRRHLRGEIKLTRNDLSHRDWNGRPPRIIALQVSNQTGAEAYRTVLCYHRIYESHGFYVLSYDKVDEQAYNMLPQTEKVYNQLHEEEITKEFLVHGISVAENEGQKDPEQRYSLLPATTQINIRLSEEEKIELDRFCASNRLTQRQALIYLLHDVSSEAGDNPLLKELRDDIERKQAIIDDLSKKLCSASRGQVADKKLKEALATAREIVCRYIELIPPSTGPLLKCKSRQHSRRDAYQYPYGAGTTILELHDLCYGKGRNSCLFVKGIDESTGELLRFRFYDKRTFIGIRPAQNLHATEGSRWFVSFKPASDGAVELTAAIPLPANIFNASKSPSEPADEYGQALDDLIDDAEYARK